MRCLRIFLKQNLGDGFRYLIQMSHFNMTSIIFDNSKFKASALCIIFLTLDDDECPNYLCIINICFSFCFLDRVSSKKNIS